MSAFRFRRAVQGRPRLILGLLLAFSVGIVAAGQPVGHRHAAGGAQHVHAGWIRGAAAGHAAQARDPGGSGVRRASPADEWHQHLGQATVEGASSPPPSLAQSRAADQRPTDPITVVARGVVRSAVARGPPPALG